MKPTTALAILSLSLFFLYGCTQGSENSSSEDISNDTTITNSQNKSIEVRLSGVYVTSVNIPHNKFDYENLFDEDDNTYWATMQGAGSDEGIMLYFEKPQNISHM